MEQEAYFEAPRNAMRSHLSNAVAETIAAILCKRSEILLPYHNDQV